jgi:hypothetical protein
VPFSQSFNEDEITISSQSFFEWRNNFYEYDNYTNETTDATDNVTTIVKTVEQIKQNSMGFSKGLELLTNFANADSKQMVFFYFREIK